MNCQSLVELPKATTLLRILPNKRQALYFGRRLLELGKGLWEVQNCLTETKIRHESENNRSLEMLLHTDHAVDLMILFAREVDFNNPWIMFVFNMSLLAVNCELL